MNGWNETMQLIQWIVRIVGGGISLIGLVIFLISFGDSGTGDQRRLGIIMLVGGFAAIAAASLVPVFFPAPPSF